MTSIAQFGFKQKFRQYHLNKAFQLRAKVIRPIGRRRLDYWKDLDEILDLMDAELAIIMEELKEEFKDQIRAGAFNGLVPPLSQPYLDKKRKAGLHTQILMATGDYLDAIEVQRLGRNKYRIGVADRVHEPSGLHMEAIRRILEYGSMSANIPPRKIWTLFMQRVLNSEARVSQYRNRMNDVVMNFANSKSKFRGARLNK